MRRKPDLALVMYSLAGGGAERALVNLAGAFTAGGMTVDMVLCRAEGAYLDALPEAVRVIDCNARSSLEWRRALEGYLREARPSAMLVAMEGAGVVALSARQRTGVACRIVVSSQNNFSRHTAAAAGFKERWLLPWFVRWFYRKADAVVAVSTGVADDIARCAWLPRAGVQVIHNPVVTDALMEQAKAKPEHPWFAPGRPPVILAAGRLTSQKDFPTLLRAFAGLSTAREARLIVMGEGEGRSALEGMAQELGIAGAVSFPSFVRNPYALMARADLFVLSSAWEGFGNVLVEAMACGCPVVSTDCPSGPAEILEDGTYGRLVPVGEHQALAAAMAATLDTPPDPRRLKLRAMDFHVERIAEQYLNTLALTATHRAAEAA